VTYVIAALVLAAACMAWYALQCWSGTPDSSLWRDPRSDCDGCSERDAGCASAPAEPGTCEGKTTEGG
jgi:hypothetical protein